MSDLRQERIDAAQLASVKIMFSKVFDDTPVDEEIRDSIYQEIMEDEKTLI